MSLRALRTRVTLIGCGLTLLGLLPVLLGLGAWQAGGGWRVFGLPFAVLLSPLLFLLRFGPRVVWLAWKGLPTEMPFTAAWVKKQDEDVVEAEFED